MYFLTVNEIIPSIIYILVGSKWQQSVSRAQHYVPIFITIRPNENLKIIKLLIILADKWDS